MVERKIIFIAGPSASGKTTLARLLSQKLRALGYSSRIISKDHYFYPKEDDVPIEPYRSLRNFDCEAAFNYPLLREHLSALLQGNSITKGIFDFSVLRCLETETIAPADFLIVEGIFALNFAETLDETLRSASLTVFVSVTSYMRLLRMRLKRDPIERKMDVNLVLEKERTQVGPAFFQDISRSRSGADLVIENELPLLPPILSSAKGSLAVAESKTARPSTDAEVLDEPLEREDELTAFGDSNVAEPKVAPVHEPTDLERGVDEIIAALGLAYMEIEEKVGVDSSAAEALRRPTA